MPVTARLLERLHESLGSDATSDLFAWWEEASAVNRVAVREVADLYFARFEARLEKGLAEIRSEIAVFRADVDKRFAELRGEMDKRFAKIEVEMDKRFAAIGSELDKRSEEVGAKMANQRADLVKWMFIFWAGTIMPLAGLMIALIKL